MFKKILFTTDFSPHAETAKQIAKCLAQLDGAELWALTVLEPVEEPLSMADEPPEIPPWKWEKKLARMQTRLKSEKRRKLDQDVADLRAQGLTVHELVREGDPDKEILAAAKEIDADVIVMGSHSRRNLWDVVLGNIAQRVVENASCPVVLVSHQPPHPGPEAPKHYLLATDFSPHARLAEKVAIALAKARGEDKKLWTLTVIRPGEELPMPPGFVVNAPDGEVVELEDALREDVEAEVSRRLDVIVADAAAAGLKVEKLIRHGDPAKETLKAAIDIEADMIIMGSHSRKSLKEKLLGDTPEKVAKQAPCPVLIVSHLPENIT
jgi:nucleotide-binding universal stress UspA family protein